MGVERLSSVRGTALPVRGDDIDTDRIIPARFLKSIRFDGLDAHLFEDDRAQTAAGIVHPAANPAYAGASIMLVQANFGCGSSREHAPQAIQRRGIRAIVGESYSEIFYGNAATIGMPCVKAAKADVDAVMDRVESDPALLLELDLNAMQLRAGGTSFAVSLPPGARESFLDGSWDATGLLLEDFAQVRARGDALPYVTGRW